MNREDDHLDAAIDQAAARMVAVPDDPEMVARLVPMKRAGSPEEIASVVAYLASDAASYISGQIISVNGAMA